MLDSWRDTPTREAITTYVERDAPADGRIAVFDNDGTLWSEKPIPIQLDFTMFRLAEQAEADPLLSSTSNRTNLPYGRDYHLARQHDESSNYDGNDADLGVLMKANRGCFRRY